MADLKDVPLFKVGTWNGMTFNETDLDDMASNSQLLKEELRIPLKLGHTGKSKDQLADDGSGLEQPALGFVENVRRIGDQLVADFRDVPKIVKDAIAKRLYSGLSIELLQGVTYRGKTLRHVLDAVALLGASQPAVSGLKDLATYLASRKCFEDEGERVVFEVENQQEKPSIDEAAVKLMIAQALEPMKQANDALQKQFEAEKKRAAKFESELLERKADEIKERRAKAEQIIETAVKQSLITPAQRETFTKLLQIDRDEVVIRDGFLDDVQAAFSERKPIAFSVDGVGFSDPANFEREADVFAEVERRIKAHMKKHEVDYMQASRVVFTEDPKLHSEYLSTDPPKHTQGLS